MSVTDMHLHLVDFSQKTEGLRALIDKMKQANIGKSVIFGLPVIKKWAESEPERPSYYLDDDSPCYYFASTDEIVASEYLKLSVEEQSMLAPTLCGFNPTDRLAIDYVEFMFNKYPFWQGIGELLLRHDDLTALTEGEPARVNHPALYDVYAFCAERNLPVCIHQNSTSAGHHDRFEYLHEMKETLEKFPQTTFIWAHCGCSRRVSHKNYAAMIREMLICHQNLWVDLSWVIYEDAVCHCLEPKPTWVKLIKDFPDRFMLGTDLCGHFEHLGKTVARYNNLINLLPLHLSERIARKNAEELYFPSQPPEERQGRH
ncbi:MAG: amidohydrolase family protein [Syntrophales bacterium]|nr:amidohydrolase family protein [Syntrophales bacterium]MDD5640220.1 amidohydrolase family protein [Syntrophales bacterium]